MALKGEEKLNLYENHKKSISYIHYLPNSH